MSGRQDVFQQAMNQGHSAAWDQLWDRAVSYYRQALDEFPDHPQALTSLGLALYELQEYDQSLQAYLRAAKVMVGDPLPLEKVAQLYERLGNLEQACQASLAAAEFYMKNREPNRAIENWLRVTVLRPENMQAHSRLALVYERMGEKHKAVNEYLALASLLQTAGDMERAVKAVTQALKILPDNEEVAAALSLLSEQKPLPKPARPRGGTAPLRMSQVRQLDSIQGEDELESGLDPVSETRQTALTVLAGMLFDGGDEDPGGRRDLQAMVSGSGSLPRPVDRTRIILHLSQVVDLQTNGQLSQAAGELERAIAAGLEHPAAFFDLGFLKVESGQAENAVQHLQLAVKHPAFALGGHLLLADIYQKTRRTREAALEYLEALKAADMQMVAEEDSGDLAQLYEPLIEAQKQLSDADLQTRLCENISSLLVRPDWREHLTRARSQLPVRPAGSPPMPLAEIMTVARSSQVIDTIANIHELANRGDLRAAMEEAYFALQSAPTYLPLHSFMGELLLKQGRMQDAIAKLLVVARSYAVRGDTQRAIELYRRILTLAPMDMGARKLLIDQLVERGQVPLAIAEYLSLTEVYYNLADLNMVRKTYTEALHLAQQSKVDRSWRVKILHGMADIDLQSLDWRQALRIYEQIRTMQPDDEKSRASLIDLNFRLGQEAQAIGELDNYITYLCGVGQDDQAIQFVENLINENPDRLQVHQRAADLYRQAGRTQDAIRHLDLLGEALLNADNLTGAVQVIESILDLDPPNKIDYQQLLLQIRGR